MNFLRRYADKAPIVATVLLEYANAGQLFRMWTEYTAAGQSLWSWLAVNAALWCYQLFYRVHNPGHKWVIRCNAFGIALNSCVCLTVAYFRYFA